jgi:predicted alpha/beta superfamily hydrolase
MDFVISYIKPFIDNKYRTKPDAIHTAVGGSSMGGIMSFAMVWQYPQVFSKAIVMSPALKIDHIDYVSEVQSSEKPSTPVYFYIDNGGIGLEKKLQPGIDEMLQVLTTQHDFHQFTWVQDVDGRHSEADWAKRLPQAFKILFPNLTDNKNK